MEEAQLQDSIFEKIMPVLDEYMMCKLKLQQLRQLGERFPGIEQEISHNLKFYAGKIKEIITQDSENQ